MLLEILYIILVCVHVLVFMLNEEDNGVNVLNEEEGEDGEEVDHRL